MHLSVVANLHSPNSKIPFDGPVEYNRYCARHGSTISSGPRKIKFPIIAWERCSRKEIISLPLLLVIMVYSMPHERTDRRPARHLGMNDNRKRILEARVDTIVIVD